MKKLLLLTLFFLNLFLVSCAGTGSPPNGLARINGQITWQDGGTLPAGSKVTVTIVNASIADTSDILATANFTAEGSPPLDFYVEYDPAKVDERANYSATVRIEDSTGTLLYITMTVQYVIEQGQPVADPIILVEPV